MESEGHENKINDYRDLRVWKAGMDLAASVYSATRSFPREEAFGMTSQMRRAAASIPANIAEGFGREQRQPFIQFLRISQGSLKELETHALLAQRVGLLTEGIAKQISRDCEELGKMLRAFIRRLQEKKAERAK
jgi:four helix bundle protein